MANAATASTTPLSRVGIPGGTPGHIPALDGVRGLAVLLVLLFHFRYYLLGPEPIQSVLALFGEFGWVGVDLFFVLSGFLITRILLATRGRDGFFSFFYARRVLRIFPLYYGVLAVLFFGPFRWMGDALPPQVDHRWYWAYLSNWSLLLHRVSPTASGHLWSLAVEEQFYIVWPFLVWSLSSRNLMRLVAILCFLAPAWRIVLLALHWPPEWIYRNSLSRMDALLMGAAVALALANGSLPTPRTCRTTIRVAACAVAVALIGFRIPIHDGPLMQAFGYSMIALVFSGGIALIVTENAPALIALTNRRWLREAGKYSYGIYIFHLPVLAGAEHLFAPQMHRLVSAGLGFLVVLPLTAAATLTAVASYQLFERPAMKLKRYIEPARSANNVAAIKATAAAP